MVAISIKSTLIPRKVVFRQIFNKLFLEFEKIGTIRTIEIFNFNERFDAW